MTDMTGSNLSPSDLPRLGTLECQVMDALWDHGSGTVREVIARLPSELAYTTIATVLGNLNRKSLLTVTRQGRATHYAPRIPREEYAAEVMAQVLQTSGNRGASIAAFVESIAQEDLDLLRAYLHRREELAQRAEG